MKLRDHMSSTRWGDYIFALLFFSTCYLFFQVMSTWFINEPFAYGMLVISIIYTIISFVMLLRKNRVLRDWMYLVYGMLFTLVLYFFRLSTIPGYSIEGRNLAYVAFVFLVIIAVISSLVRLMLRATHQGDKSSAEKNENDVNQHD